MMLVGPEVGMHRASGHALSVGRVHRVHRVLAIALKSFSLHDVHHAKIFRQNFVKLLFFADFCANFPVRIDAKLFLKNSHCVKQQCANINKFFVKAPTVV